MNRWARYALLFSAAGVLAANAAFAEDETGWSGEVAASLSAQTGTTDTVLATVDANTTRAWEKDTAALRFSGSYGTTRKRPDGEDEATQNAQALYGDWKRIIHDRFFWNGGSELSRDQIQDRDVRFAINTGPGYRFWEGESAQAEHFDVAFGVGYRYERYDPDTAPGDPDRGRADQYNLADLVASFEYKNNLFEDRIEWTHTGSAKMPANDVNAYVLTTEAIAGLPLTEAWSLRISFFVEYLKTQPKQVNNLTTRTTLGLGYKF